MTMFVTRTGDLSRNTDQFLCTQSPPLVPDSCSQNTSWSQFTHACLSQSSCRMTQYFSQELQRREKICITLGRSFLVLWSKLKAAQKPACLEPQQCDPVEVEMPKITFGVLYLWCGLWTECLFCGTSWRLSRTQEPWLIPSDEAQMDPAFHRKLRKSFKPQALMPVSLICRHRRGVHLAARFHNLRWALKALTLLTLSLIQYMTGHVHPKKSYRLQSICVPDKPTLVQNQISGQACHLLFLPCCDVFEMQAEQWSAQHCRIVHAQISIPWSLFVNE